jgi:hypothetical protein
VRSISEKAPFVLARVALKNIALPRALNNLPSPASRTVALSRIGVLPASLTFASLRLCEKNFFHLSPRRQGAKLWIIQSEKAESAS